MSRHVVLGSLNMDMVARVDRFPLPGETLRGNDFGVFPGGKGANQAVALARLGADVAMLGAVGDDVLGARYRSLLSEEGVDVSRLAVLPGLPTGSAVIEVAASGENHIVIVPGANAAVTPDFVEANRALIEGAKVLLLQLEIPMESVVLAARDARRAGVLVLLDPAPAAALPAELLSRVSVITPNETELAFLTGVDCVTDGDIARASGLLLDRGVAAVVVKAGARGAYWNQHGTCRRVPGYEVDVVDTVGAGDSFSAGLGFAMERLLPAAVAADGGLDALARAPMADMMECLRFANAVGGLATTARGAQGGMPTKERVDLLMASDAS